jgi:phage-related protein
MPKTLPAALVLEKNKIASANPWLLLADLNVDGEHLRIVNNNESITFQSNLYQAFEFKFDAITSTKDGKIPTFVLSVPNINRMFIPYIEDTNGLVDTTVDIYIVNAGLLSENYSELTMNFVVMGCNYDSQVITLQLSTPSPMRQRFPKNRFIAKYCPWPFKGVECKYSGADTTCQRTHDDCEAKGNLLNFGGFPGLREDGFRVV